jgi:hypothetical protein
MDIKNAVISPISIFTQFPYIVTVFETITQKSGAARASKDLNKTINVYFPYTLPKRLGLGCHLN